MQTRFCLGSAKEPAKDLDRSVSGFRNDKICLQVAAELQRRAAELAELLPGPSALRLAAASRPLGAPRFNPDRAPQFLYGDAARKRRRLAWALNARDSAKAAAAAAEQAATRARGGGGAAAGGTAGERRWSAAGSREVEGEGEGERPSTSGRADENGGDHAAPRNRRGQVGAWRDGEGAGSGLEALLLGVWLRGEEGWERA